MIEQKENPFSPILSSRSINILKNRGILRADPVLGLEKKCPCCDDWWPMDTQFFCYTCGRLESWCRACASQVRMDRRRIAGKSAPAQTRKACDELRE